MNLNDLYLREYRPLRNFALRLCGSVEVAEDAVAAVFLDLLRSEVQPDHPTSYLKRMVRNVLGRHWREEHEKRQLMERLQLQDEDRDAPWLAGTPQPELRGQAYRDHINRQARERNRRKRVA